MMATDTATWRITGNEATGVPTLDLLSGQNIVCLAHEPWHGPWKTYQQIMSLLAKKNRVLYVGPPASLREGVTGLVRRAQRRPLLECVTPTLFVYHEPRLLGRANNRRPIARHLNGITARLRLSQARWLARCCGFAAPILWVFDPMMSRAVGTFGERLVVYHVLDNYAEFIDPRATALRAAMSKNEGWMLKRADVVVAVSDSLRQRCLEHNPNSFLVPNGVNTEMFRARAMARVVPADMRHLARPIIGYVGAIQPIVDYSLLHRISMERPEWSLVLAGPRDLDGAAQAAFDTLCSRPNVHYLGCKQVGEVPVYISACDVCLMPYHPRKSTVPDSDSIKLYEYLACGRPVVSVDVSSAARFSPLVRIARDEEEFVKGVEESLAEGSRFVEARELVASEHSWQQRVATLSQILTPLLAPGASTDRSSATSRMARR
ncbi:MAG TPA: glycosyltransferase [bacterium]|nr:glycosyltransferase [bacterium]